MNLRTTSIMTSRHWKIFRLWWWVRSVEVFFIVNPNKLLNNFLSCLWFETPYRVCGFTVVTHSWLLFHTDELHYGTAIFSEIHLCELEFSFDIFRYLVKYSSVPCHEETELFFTAGHRQFLCVSTGWHWLFLLNHHIGWYLRYWIMYEYSLKNWRFTRTHSRIITHAAHLTSLSIFVNKKNSFVRCTKHGWPLYDHIHCSRPAVSQEWWIPDPVLLLETSPVC